MDKAVGYLCQILVKFDSPICQILSEALGGGAAQVSFTREMVEKAGDRGVDGMCLDSINQAVAPKGIKVSKSDVCVLIVPITQPSIQPETK